VRNPLPRSQAPTLTQRPWLSPGRPKDLNAAVAHRRGSAQLDLWLQLGVIPSVCALRLPRGPSATFSTVQCHTIFREHTPRLPLLLPQQLLPLAVVLARDSSCYLPPSPRATLLSRSQATLTGRVHAT